MTHVVLEVPVTQARAELADLVNRVVYTGEHVVLTRHGRPVAALVPASEVARFVEDTQVATSSAAHPPHAVGPTDAPAPLRIAAHHEPAPPPAGSTPGPWL